MLCRPHPLLAAPALHHCHVSLSPATSTESGVRDLEDRNHAAAKRSAAAELDHQSQSSAIIRQNEAAIGSTGQDGAAQKDANDSCPMHDLPDEVFAPILDMCDIRQLFDCMSVSKRWQAGCGYVIRLRELLIIGHEEWYVKKNDQMRGWNWHRERPSERLDSIPLVDDPLMPVMLKSLNRMENLTRLCLAGISPVHAIPFIRQLADKLTMLSMDLNIGEVGPILFPRLTQLHCRVSDAEMAWDSSTFPKLEELVIDEPGEDANLQDGKLSSLKRLRIIGDSEQSYMRDFIAANAMSLEFLSVDFIELEFSPEVVFQALTELHSSHGIGGVMANAFPAIKSLDVNEGTSVALLKSLPAAQMLSLSVRLVFPIVGIYDDEEEEEDKLEEWVAAIARMVNLKELNIIAECEYMQEIPDVSYALSFIFDRMHQLEKVSIYFSDDRNRGGNADTIMSSLVQQNANLSHIQFSGLIITAAAHESMAQLHHLSHITLDMDRASEMTIDGVVTLLRGSSREVIREFKVSSTVGEVDRVTREIELMAQERGGSFEKVENHWESWDQTHYFVDYKIRAS